MSVGELEDIKTVFKDIEKYRRVLADIENCVERIELGVVKQEGKERREEFQKIYSKVNQVKSQLAIDEEALHKGEISQGQFEKKLAGLIDELSKVDLELDRLKPKLCDIIDKINDFTKKGIISEEEKVVIISKLDYDKNLLLSEKEWRRLKGKEGREEYTDENIYVTLKPDEKSEEKTEERIEEKIEEKIGEKKEEKIEEKKEEKNVQKVRTEKTKKDPISSSFTEIWKTLLSKRVLMVCAILGVFLILVVVIYSNHNPLSNVRRAPIVEDFSASVASGASQPSKVHFTSDVTGNPAYYHWEFEPEDEDYYSFDNKTANHVFHEPGIYNVSLTVENEFGRSKLTKKKYINVTPNMTSIENVSITLTALVSEPKKIPVVEDLTADVTSGVYNQLTVHFESNVIGNPTNYYWEFERTSKDWSSHHDRSSSKDNKTSQHLFGEPGMYDVSLTVENEFGSSTLTKENFIKVMSRP